jgi:hypothetical protein
MLRGAARARNACYRKPDPPEARLTHDGFELAGSALEGYLGRARQVWALDDSTTGATPDVARTLTVGHDGRLELRVEHHASYWGPFVELDVTVRGRFTIAALDAARFALRIVDPVLEVRAGSDGAVAALRRAIETCELRGGPDALWFAAPG